jgi:hypothetical protein
VGICREKSYKQTNKHPQCFSKISILFVQAPRGKKRGGGERKKDRQKEKDMQTNGIE